MQKVRWGAGTGLLLHSLVRHQHCSRTFTRPCTCTCWFPLQIIGRLAAQLSLVLQGKDKPIFAPHRDHGDVCIVVNAERAVFTGNKWEGKLYKWHTGALMLKLTGSSCSKPGQT